MAEAIEEVTKVRSDAKARVKEREMDGGLGWERVVEACDGGLIEWEISRFRGCGGGPAPEK
jgi:hypothetical protein